MVNGKVMLKMKRIYKPNRHGVGCGRLKTCSFKCPDELLLALESATEATGRNRSQIIVEAIRFHFPEILRRWERERAEAMSKIARFSIS